MVTRHAKIDEIEREVRAQIDRMKELGLTKTHLDSHMGVVFERPDMIRMLDRLAKDYQVPAKFVVPTAANSPTRYCGYPLAVLTRIGKAEFQS